MCLYCPPLLQRMFLLHNLHDWKEILVDGVDSVMLYLLLVVFSRQGFETCSEFRDENYQKIELYYCISHVNVYIYQVGLLRLLFGSRFQTRKSQTPFYLRCNSPLSKGLITLGGRGLIISHEGSMTHNKQSKP